MNWRTPAIQFLAQSLSSQRLVAWSYLDVRRSECRVDIMKLRYGCVIGRVVERRSIGLPF